MTTSRSELKRLKALNNESYRNRIETLKASLQRRMKTATENNDTKLLEALQREADYIDRQY